MKQLMLYLPVIHAGYEMVFDRHADAAEVLLLGTGFADDFPVLKKEIRALAPARAARYVEAGTDIPTVRVIEPLDLPDAVTADLLVIPDEELMREIADRYDLGKGRELLVERTFLRWDRGWSLAQRPPDYAGAIAVDGLAREFALVAAAQAEHSSDWWRRVGALVARDGHVLATAYNRHHPTEYSPYLDGDPRNDFKRGVRIDLSTAVHAEAALIGRAARDGMALAGADLYVSTFPCPGCARLIAEAGFRRCYFAGPYSVLDGDAVMRAAGVELIWVDLSGSEVAS